VAANAGCSTLPRLPPSHQLLLLPRVPLLALLLPADLLIELLLLLLLLLLRAGTWSVPAGAAALRLLLAVSVGASTGTAVVALLPLLLLVVIVSLPMLGAVLLVSGVASGVVRVVLPRRLRADERKVRLQVR